MSSPKGNAERAPGGGRHFFAENLKNFRGCCTCSCNRGQMGGGVCKCYDYIIMDRNNAKKIAEI